MCSAHSTRSPGQAPSWLLIGVALALFAVGDSIYLYATANGTYVEGGLLDLTWPAALVLMGRPDGTT
jgi:nitrogen fixation-related uncharacterized protein